MSSHTFSNLANGTSYNFRVRAVNIVGASLSASATSIPIGVPFVPQNFRVQPGDGRVSIAWAAPTSNGGSAITGYQVSHDNGTTWVNASSATSHTFTGLVNGTNYTFRVRALNRIGASAAAMATAIPSTTARIAFPPRNLTATPGNRQVVLNWAAPSNNGGSAIIRFQVSSNNGATWVTASSAVNHTFTGLTNGTSYNFMVRAVNAVGVSTPANVTGIPATVPTMPRNITVTPGNHQLRFNWSAPSNNGGSAITHYQVSRDYGETWVNASSITSHTFTGLNNDTWYFFRVRAVNAAGGGEPANISGVPSATVTVPAEPRDLIATPDDRQVTLNWVVPWNNGGAAITRYQVSRDNGANWVNASSMTSHTFTGLTNGTSYNFRVRAINSVGASLSAGVPGIPGAAPFVPRNFRVHPGNGRVSIAWAAPLSNGGAAITHYQVSRDDGVNWVTASSATSHTFTGLTNGTNYTFRVRAVNRIGASASAMATARPSTTATASFMPRNLTATPGNRQVVLNWAAPSNNGGSLITHFQVSSNNGATWVTASSAVSHTFTNLTNGTPYNFRVRAVNAVGASAAATTTATPTPVLG